MFSKILVANRGEIALRIIRACKEMDIRTVVVYSDVDINSLPVQLADEAICIGSHEPHNSYLNIPAIISAAEITDVEAIHPGYGFLAENAHFAEVCESCQIKFIGPTPDSIRKMGNKLNAKITMKKNDVPVIPGSLLPIKNKDEALKVANQIKYPVIIKASAGGGGKGMRVAHNDVRLTNAVATAQAEAEKNFGNPEIYIEKYFELPRHIEIQIMADNHGNVIHLGERDCTIQRRHQKLLEEAPSPAINKKIRKKMGDTAVKATKAVNYSGVGTIEFLLDEKDNFYFMEMNTRIQVEHTITEMVTGIDIIKEQINIAAGKKLSVSQDKVEIRGHAIECRINAEDFRNGFIPSPGKIEVYHAPSGPGVRLDSAAYQGYVIPPYYDSMIAKLITYGKNRQEAIAIMKRALDEYFIHPIKTTVDFHKKVLNNQEFVKGQYYTNFAQKLLDTTD
ncbi:MAG: acetyl-CoA carboxylase biotin carboxylase subunit [Candidatus Kappaea frigidicola]|nr:acetyl-CoA carboxylase biotin carboxylase subunit [Candidatus Kappaea frigidicola]